MQDISPLFAYTLAHKKKENEERQNDKIKKRGRKGTREDCPCDQKPEWIRVHVFFDRYSLDETAHKALK